VKSINYLFHAEDTVNERNHGLEVKILSAVIHNGYLNHFNTAKYCATKHFNSLMSGDYFPNVYAARNIKNYGHSNKGTYHRDFPSRVLMCCDAL
jgi:hypothetical protein